MKHYKILSLALGLFFVLGSLSAQADARSGATTQAHGQKEVYKEHLQKQKALEGVKLTDSQRELIARVLSSSNISPEERKKISQLVDRLGASDRHQLTREEADLVRKSLKSVLPTEEQVKQLQEQADIATLLSSQLRGLLGDTSEGGLSLSHEDLQQIKKASRELAEELGKLNFKLTPEQQKLLQELKEHHRKAPKHRVKRNHQHRGKSKTS